MNFLYVTDGFCVLICYTTICSFIFGVRIQNMLQLRSEKIFKKEIKCPGTSAWVALFISKMYKGFVNAMSWVALLGAKAQEAGFV